MYVCGAQVLLERVLFSWIVMNTLRDTTQEGNFTSGNSNSISVKSELWAAADRSVSDCAPSENLLLHGLTDPPLDQTRLQKFRDCDPSSESTESLLGAASHSWILEGSADQLSQLHRSESVESDPLPGGAGARPAGCT